MGRSPCCDKAAVKRGPWSAEEDARLRSYIEQNGTGGSWIALPRNAGLRRCGKSCRLRWLNYLRPDLRHGGFSPEEDRVICALYAAVGSRWSLIAAHLPGRTDNGVKNYWNTRLKKKHLGGKRLPSLYPHGRRHCHQDANVDAVPAPLVPPLPPWSSQQYGTTGCGGGGVDHMHTHVGAGGDGTRMIASTSAAIASQPANTSYSCEPAATELDEIFRSIGTSCGGEPSDLSQSSMDMEAHNWYHCELCESVLQQQHLGMPYSYW